MRDRVVGRNRSVESDDGDQEYEPSSQYEERRAQMITRAASLLRKGQRVGFSVDDLCARLGINKSTFYRYFRSKEDLLFSLHQSAMDGLDEMLARAFADHASALDRLTAVIIGHIHLQQRWSGILPIAQKGALSPRNRRVVVRRRDEYEAKIRTLIRDGIAEGALRECDPELQSILLLSMLNSVQYWYKEGGRYSLDELGRIVVETVFAGLLRRGSGDGQVRAVSSE